MTEQQQIGERLNQIIKELGLIQKAFAQSLGVQQGFINNVIKGKKGIGHKVIINIAKEYKQFSIRWLLTGEGDMHRYPNYYPPPELESGQPDKLEEGIRIEYAKPEEQLETMRRMLEDHERRLRDLEGR